MDYDANDTMLVIFTGYIFKLKKYEKKKFNRSEYGKKTDFKQDVFEVIGKNCYNPTNRYCFIKFDKYLTCKDYKQIILDLSKMKN